MNVMSLLGPEDIVRLNGIPPQAVAAGYAGNELPENLQGNPPFVALMHDVIRRRAPESPEIRAAARDQRDGHVYVIDANTPDGINGRVPPQDILGAFKVEGGRIVAGSYDANSRYAVFRRGRGLVQLPGALHHALLEELRALAPL